MLDLVLRGGRIIDPAQGLDEVLDIAFADGRVAALGHDLGEAADTRDVSGKIVTPGLIDLHTHVYWGGTSLGVDPDAYAKGCGCTTVVDAGSAGPGVMRDPSPASNTPRDSRRPTGVGMTPTSTAG